MFCLGWPFPYFPFYPWPHRPKVKTMPTPQEMFDDATGKDAKVDADRKQLESDSAEDAASHKALNDDVIANGLVVVNGPAGHLILLEPNAAGDGIVTPPKVVRDGTKPSLPPAPTP